MATRISRVDPKVDQRMIRSFRMAETVDPVHDWGSSAKAVSPDFLFRVLLGRTAPTTTEKVHVDALLSC
jgi:hypothetical protein